MDWISTLISICALGVSLVSLYVSIRIANRTWERQAKLPYYRDLNQFIENIEEIFSKEIGIYHIPDFDHVRHTASSLGLTELVFNLDDIHQLMKNLDEQRHQERRNIAKERADIGAIEARVDAIKTILKDDTKRLTQSKPRIFNS